MKKDFKFFLMLLNSDDKTLAARISQGDSEAENYLFFAFKERIKFLVRSRFRGRGSLEDQKDVISEIQQALLTSLRKGGYDPHKGKPLEAYVAGVAANIVAQYFRKRSREKLNENIDSHYEIESPGNILSDIVDNERREKLKFYLNKIKPKYTEVLLLRFYEYKTIEEISEYLHLERRRVSERINYAFKLLLKECKKDKYFQ